MLLDQRGPHETKYSPFYKRKCCSGKPNLLAKKETSVSKLLTEQLAKMVSEDEQYDSAKKRPLTILKKGFHLGGCVIAKLEELHERR